MDRASEIERIALQRTVRRVRAARWDLDVAVFIFAVMTIVVILEFEGVGVEVVAPSAAVGLGLAWLMGWKKGQNLFLSFYREELSQLRQNQVIDDIVRKELREKLG